MILLQKIPAICIKPRFHTKASRFVMLQQIFFSVDRRSRHGSSTYRRGFSIFLFQSIVDNGIQRQIFPDLFFQNLAETFFHIIVRIHEDDPLSGSSFHTIISGRRQAPILFMKCLHKEILLCILIAQGTTPIRTSIIHQQDLQLFRIYGLVNQRIHTTIQISFHFIDRNDDGKLYHPIFHFVNDSFLILLFHVHSFLFLHSIHTFPHTGSFNICFSFLKFLYSFS